MRYLIRRRGKIKAAHFWNGADTSCRMASTGGLKLDRFDLFDTPEGLKICHMCAVNQTKNEGEMTCG